MITLPPDAPASDAPAPERPDQPAADPPAADQTAADQPAAVRPATPARPAAPVDAARLLPEVSRDETDEGWGERPDRSDDDRFLDEVPPHHVG